MGRMRRSCGCQPGRALLGYVNISSSGDRMCDSRDVWYISVPHQSGFEAVASTHAASLVVVGVEARSTPFPLVVVRTWVLSRSLSIGPQRQSGSPFGRTGRSSIWLLNKGLRHTSSRTVSLCARPQAARHKARSTRSRVIVVLVKW